VAGWGLRVWFWLGGFPPVLVCLVWVGVFGGCFGGVWGAGNFVLGGGGGLQLGVFLWFRGGGAC